MSAEARFRELFGEHYPTVARYVLARGFQAADADDLIAATFEVAWRRLDAVPDGEEALPWLLSTARNFARNADRKAHREQTLVNGLAHTTAMERSRSRPARRMAWRASRARSAAAS